MKSPKRLILFLVHRSRDQEGLLGKQRLNDPMTFPGPQQCLLRQSTVPVGDSLSKQVRTGRDFKHIH